MSRVVEILNLARAMELQAISLYMQQHYILSDKLMHKLAHAMKKIAIQEMRHAELLAERILDLDGKPSALPAGPTQPGADVLSLYAQAFELERETTTAYQQYVSELMPLDAVSGDLLKRILAEESGHQSYFFEIQEIIRLSGDTFLSLQTGGKYAAPDYVKKV